MCFLGTRTVRYQIPEYCAHTSMHAQTHQYVCVVSMYAYIHTYIHTFIHTYIHTYIRTYISTCVRACVYNIHIHLYMIHSPVFNGCVFFWKYVCITCIYIHISAGSSTACFQLQARSAKRVSRRVRRKWREKSSWCSHDSWGVYDQNYQNRGNSGKG